MGGFQALLGTLSEAGKTSDKKKKDEPANVKAAESISEGVFHPLIKSEKEPAGMAMHSAIGEGSGLIYGIAAELAPVSAVDAGLPFGAAVWLLTDEIAIPALGLSKPVTAFPLSTHANALSSHLVYGLCQASFAQFNTISVEFINSFDECFECGEIFERADISKEIFAP
jgi:hypothetical protein